MKTKIQILLLTVTSFSFVANVLQAQSWTPASPNIYFTGGNVGIGTTGPNAKLEVSGSASPGIFVSSTNYPGAYRTQLGTQSGAQGILVLGNNGANEIRFGSTAAGGAGSIYVNNTADYTTAVAGTLAMYFKSDGNIGIGTTSPFEKLHLHSGTGDGDTYNTVFALSRTSTTGNVEVAKLVLDDMDTNYGNLVFKVKTTASSAESPTYYTDAMTIKGSNGYVGIGTTVPVGKLEIQSGLVNNTPDNVSAMILTRNIGATQPRRMYMIPHLSAGAMNLTTRSGDMGVFWTDGAEGAGTSGKNNTAGLIIAPYGGSNNGIRITSQGNVGIGTALDVNPNGYKLAVNGLIGAKAVKVEISSTTWADYVFEKEYKLISLNELEAFVKTHKHLPNVPSGVEVERSGIDVATMDAKLLEKIEELSLYIIEQNKRIEILEEKISIGRK